MFLRKKRGNTIQAEQKPQKSERIILQHTEEAALTQMKRSTLGLGLSGISAGLDVGFSVLLMAAVVSGFQGVFPAPVVNWLTANMYPIGFIFVILGRSELFTEHTTLAILPVLQGLASLKNLLRLWVIVFISNILGGMVFSLILSYFAGELKFIEGASLDAISYKFLTYQWPTLLLSAMLAGWMMGLLAWLVAASRETISQIAVIWIITASIGFAGLPHCIVGNIEVMTNMFRGAISFSQYIGFMAPVTVGNAIGGLLFVGIMKFSHTRLSGKESEVTL